ncbi:MAG: ATP-dependent DNA helicase RecG [Verrucomicrobia bacterium]|nr:ATP-dependent DNA helicase RecG [Verrucomicrobiota bacterium]
MIEPETSLEELSWIPRPRITALRRLHVANVRDLLTHYPRRHEDRREFAGFPRDETAGPVCLCGEVTKTRLMRFGGRKIFEAVLEEESAHALSQPLTCRWFNLHYVQKMIATGHRLVVFGKVKRKGARLILDHPEFEVIENDDELLIHFRRITPIYPATEGLSQRVLRSLIYRVLEESNVAGADVPLPVQLQNGACLKGEALRHIHFPESEAQLRAVREKLVLSEFFGMQMQVAWQHAQNAMRSGQRHAARGDLVERFIRSLPFAFTPAQKRVLSEIRSDMERGAPMNRLLQGDVGSGKTVIAIAAMLLAVESGGQAALMAPTQILAEQHYDVLCRWLVPLGLSIALRTAARQDESFFPLLNGDAPQIIVGTHALLYDSVEFSRLGLAVVDEQHKFGVSQRAKLTAREPAPDVLVMTATPIPRTLTMTIYGDLDVSTIDEMPRGRGKIHTGVLGAGQIGEAVNLIRDELKNGRQAYIVYPLIDESEKLQSKAAAHEFSAWQERLRPFTCELLHGRVAPAEKQAIMERFRAGETRALVSTTVIEVGVDVPNATVMLIENAERFGLSQLHQLRGRTGRGAHVSHCLLLTAEKSPDTLAKLAVMERTTDGFEIAEADWELRGPGDLLGTAQSGLPEFKLGDLKRDAALMRRARAAAVQIIEGDPLLERPENQRFRSLIVERQEQLFSHVS